MKKAPIVALGIITAGVLALTTACSGTPTPAANGKVTLGWTVWAGSEAETSAWQHLADLVHQKEPNITVKLTTAAWPDYWTKLPTVLAGSNVPCIVGLQMGHVPDLAASFPPLDSRLAAAGIKLTDFDPYIIKALQVDGKQLAIPYDYGPYIMYYNKDAFAKAGVADPQNGWKLADFEAAAKKLTTGKQYGFAVNNQLDAMQEWGPTVGGAQAVTEANKLNVNTPEIKKTLDWYSGLVSTLHVAAPLAAANTAGDGAQFLGGNAAMYVDGPWSMINVKTQAKFNVGVVTLPVGDSGQATTVGGSGFGLSSKCDQPDAAMKAIAIITGDEALNYLGSVGRAWPARPADQASWYKAAVDGAQATLEMAAATAVPYRATPSWNQDTSAWTQGVIPVLNGDAPSDAFLKSVQDQSPSQP